MAELIACEFYLLSYVPDPVREEFINIGVLLREDGREETTRIRLTHDWSRVLCLDPEADMELLPALEASLAGSFNAGGSASKRSMKVLEESLSGVVQLKGPRGVYAQTLDAEMDNLMRLYVEPRPPRI